MKVKVILSAVALLCVGFAAQAQEVKIGYTNVEFIMDLMPEMEQIAADIKDYETQLQTTMQLKGEDFQRQVQAFEQASQSMTEEARAAKVNELTALQNSLQKMESDSQISYQRKLGELLGPVQTKVVNAINAVAAENNYTHIFAESAGQAPILLYTKEEDKFTELVLTKLGLEMPAAPAAN
ncbi:OmpH family outer membrane protein [Algoriphagus winogradskyi]|uniref:Periplasmic chaperone for outer membrane proteins Skp n=1 Tax=Algoriphagus winogradskyi TaxID=237017 RepID=A0ABY1P6Z7_9BACT|nr:OmpH family outer membrane protein [Algoriphagus winogradskyi]SMP27987.1 periplasmic chaperone for outer membrane proteins Skp [Algoriphagus winogradskyi]